jgi:hypothetical protein
MKRILFSFLFFLVIIVANARGAVWQEYYDFTNKAELAICKDDHLNALELYKQAFQLKDAVPGNIDLTNAFHLAMEVHDSTFARVMLSRLLSRGINQEFISSRLLSYYSGSESHFIQRLIGSTPNDTSGYNPIWLKIEALFNREDSLRRNLQARYHGSYGPIDTLDNVDIEVAQELRRLFGEHIPNQEQLGHYKGDIYASVMYTVIIQHYTWGVFQRRHVPMIFDTLLTNGLADFSVMPREFATMIGPWDRTVYVNGVKIVKPICFAVVELELDGEWFLPQIDESRLEPINQMRKAVGLSTIQELVTKIAFYNRQRKEGRYKQYGLAFDEMNVFDTDDPDQLKTWQMATIFPKP